MIDVNTLLSHAESAALAQVSESTIEQYAQFGLLKADRSDNSLRFRAADIMGVFHLEEAALERLRFAKPSNEAPLADQIERETVVTPTNPPEAPAYDSFETTRLLREQLDEIKRERDWLRDRVEKLETHSERDQMLLLAESETVRRLINQQKRKSFWAFALPWLGADDAKRRQS